jgi:DNA replication protein DnaC
MPDGVGKTHLACALGHIAVRRRLTVHAARADKLFTRLRASRLDNSLEAELRKLARVDLLVLDDFALKPLDATETNDFYEFAPSPGSQNYSSTSPGRPRHDESLLLN